MTAEYKNPTMEEFMKICEDIFKDLEYNKKKQMKVMTGEGGAINVATLILKGLGIEEPTREEALQYANIHFEHNGRGAYVI